MMRRRILLGAAQALHDRAKGNVASKVSVRRLSDPGSRLPGEFMSAMVGRHLLLQLELHHEVSGAARAKARDGELGASS